ncbi:MAG: hypothetical protein OEU57_09120 [Desulfuromonadales bacterium]|nr:hypothetical protein [Desulfuromonadales bacterium]MDH4025563.1 hypothetical protein [Desulfuromonadales bacterium]
MKSWLSFFVCVLLSLVLSACGRSQTVLDRVYVKNATNTRITDVRVRHEPTERYGSVNAILPHKSLDIGFSEHPLLTRKASVSWRDDDGREWTYTVALPYGRGVGKDGETMSLIYIIYPSGLINVHLLESVKNK